MGGRCRTGIDFQMARALQGVKGGCGNEASMRRRRGVMAVAGSLGGTHTFPAAKARTDLL